MNPNPRIIPTGQPAPFDKNLVCDIREGDPGTDDTVAAMIAVAQYAAQHEAKALLRLFTGPRTPRGLYEALAQNVIFKADPDRIELVPSAAQMLSAIQERGKHRGDCDDRATLGLAMMLAARLSWPCIVVCGRNPVGDFQHVYCGYQLAREAGGDFSPAEVERAVYGIDPQEGTPPGQHPAAARFRVYPVKPVGL